MHDKRRFVVADVATPEELAEKLTNHTWCSCNGFKLEGGWFFLNDSTSGDGAQEFAVVRAADMAQVESITFGWCNKEKALQYINEIVAGKYTTVYSTVENRIETPVQHGRCGACA